MNGTGVIEVDARGLEPPQPLIQILERVKELLPDGEIRARTDRRPIHLYPLLAIRGCRAETTEEPGHGYLTIIRRKS
jgi:TusA-related sulfurtransferase